MLKKNQNTKYLFYFSFLCSLHNAEIRPYSRTQPASYSFQFLTNANELHLEKNRSLTKLVLFSSLLCTTLFLNKDHLAKTIKDNSLFSLVLAIFVCNFFIDTAIKYKQIDHLIRLFELLKELNRYMLYAIAIKNTMQELSVKDTNCPFCEEDFFKNITNEIPLSFQELEQFVFELLQVCIKTIQSMHITMHTDLEEKIYLLCKEHVTINDILTLYDDDSQCCPLLKKFLENPAQHYKKTAFTLNSLIKEQFQYMIKYKSNMHER